MSSISQPGRETFVGITTSGGMMKSFCKLNSSELKSSEIVSSKFKLDKNKPIIETDIPKIIAKVIIFFINSVHSH